MSVINLDSLERLLKFLYDDSYFTPAEKPCPHCVPGFPECAFCEGKGVVPDYDDQEDGEEVR
jgi:hypothetical protein